jgi:hypothetical protein
MVAIIFTAMAIMLVSPQSVTTSLISRKMRVALQGGQQDLTVSFPQSCSLSSGEVSSQPAFPGYGQVRSAGSSTAPLWNHPVAHASMLGASILYGAGTSMLAGVVERRMGENSEIMAQEITG